LLVVALVAAVVPFLLSPPPREFRAAAEEPEPEDKRAFSAAWHLLTWRERRSLGVGLASCAPDARPNHGSIKWKMEKSTHLRANWSPQCWHLYGLSPVSGPSGCQQ
jgi:hypothetical protein